MDGDEKILIKAALLHNIKRFLGALKSDEKVEEFLKDEKVREIVLNCSNEEYAKENRICKILYISDRLSSGGEIRKSVNEFLVSIFNNVDTKDKKEILYDDAYKYEIMPLGGVQIFQSMNEIFPTESPEANKDTYKNIISNFKKDISNLNDDTTKLLFVLQKYWWCIPYEEDVSLYEHSKTTCAIASCLHKQKVSDDVLDKLFYAIKNKEFEDVALKEPFFNLIHGDIPSIQKFVYTIKSKGAAKSLKGRSLAIVLLQRFIAEHILKKLGLDLSHLIYSGGGHFHILAPKNLDGKDLKDKIDEIQKEINDEILFPKFGTKMYLCLVPVDLCANDFIRGNFSKKWEEVAKKINEQKLKKYKELGYKIFEPFDKGGYEKTCDICGTEEVSEDKEGVKFCKSCKEFKDFAGYLKDVQGEGDFDVSVIKGKISILKSFEPVLNGKIYLNPSKGVPFLNIPLGIPLSSFIKLPDGQKIEIENDVDKPIKQFEDLAEDAYNATGTRKIGILKMDVDNLGDIFTKGLWDNATISRMSNLSSMFSVFFEGYLNTFIEKEYKNEIYLIYAGGDDTLAVGRWDKMIDFADGVYKKFREYTCKNQDITISAGLVVVDPNYPLRKSVEIAEEALEKAKDFEKENHHKNAICIFNCPLRWDINEDKPSEFNMMQGIEKNLKECIDDGIPRQLIQRIKTSTKALNETKKRGGVDINEYWGLKYYLYKNYYNETNKTWKHGNINKLISNFYDKIVDNDYKPDNDKIISTNVFNKDNKDTKYNMNLITVAARIAELKTRNKDKK